MRPGHRADLMVDQKHGSVLGCKGGFVHFLILLPSAAQ
jgi:hypothetical protein